MNDDLVWGLTAAIPGFCGLGLGAWALFSDRSRGRRRCPKCWYDMDGTTGLRCPECGKEAKKETGLLKTRRKWGWVGAAAGLLVLCQAITLTPWVLRDGWWSLVSSKVLIELFPLSGPDGFFGSELFRRLGITGTRTTLNSKLTNDERAYLAGRVRHGSIFASVGSERWQRTFSRLPEANSMLFSLGFGEQRRAAVARGVSIEASGVEDAFRQLYEVPLQLSMRVREPFPTDAPLYVHMEAQSCWPWPTGWSVRVKLHDTGELLWEGGDEGFVVPAPSAASGMLLLDVEVLQYRQSEQDPTWEAVEHRSFDLPFRIAGTVADQLTPVSSPALDRLLSQSSYSVGDGWLEQDFDPTMCPATSNIAFGVILEHRLGGQVLARERAWWMGGPRDRFGKGRFDREWIGGATRCCWEADPGENWTIRIISDPQTAIRLPDAKRSWQGDVTINVINKKTTVHPPRR